MPAETNHALINEIRDALKCGRGKPINQKLIDGFEDRINEYLSACHLSRGPDKQRADHWTVKAIQCERELKRSLMRLRGG